MGRSTCRASSSTTRSRWTARWRNRDASGSATPTFCDPRTRRNTPSTIPWCTKTGCWNNGSGSGSRGPRRHAEPAARLCHHLVRAEPGPRSECCKPSTPLAIVSASDKRRANRKRLSDFHQFDGGLLRRQRNIALFAVLQCLDDALALEGKREPEVLSYHGIEWLIRSA